MNLTQSGLALIASPHDSLCSLVQAMSSKPGRLIEITVIVDSQNELLGILNHGDILRSIGSDNSMDMLASSFMVRDPITVHFDAPPSEILHIVNTRILGRSNRKKDLTRYIPLVDSNNHLIDVIDVFKLLTNVSSYAEYVDIYGLGFVGLTLGVTLSSRGHSVHGIDTNSALVNQLQAGQPHVYEPRLPEMLLKSLESQQISFFTSPPSHHHRVHIISVGTPVDAEGAPCLSALTAVCETISPRLCFGDLVMLRSTVPIGTTKSVAVPILEQFSGLIAGKDFSVAFTPERTVEGRAMQELISLPQIIGGLTPSCAQKASAFWKSITPSTVCLSSLEESEAVKLINNSYRDHSFAFANGVALFADKYNLEAKALISAANEGYPRNPIPYPSPGVGGYCLTKDPLLYASSNRSSLYASLAVNSRLLNESISSYPILQLDRFIRRYSLTFSSLTIVIVGLAFKGEPATNDTRHSPSLAVANRLSEQGANVLVHDAVLSSDEILNLGFHSGSLYDLVPQSDALLILNNHPQNIPERLLETVPSKPFFLFDGWSLLSRIEVEQYPHITYSTMGYLTSP